MLRSVRKGELLELDVRWVDEPMKALKQLRGRGSVAKAGATRGSAGASVHVGTSDGTKAAVRPTHPLDAPDG